MLNISGIREGVVLDHIQAGKSMDIYRYLRLGELDCTVAIIKNAKSNKMGRKDIIKIEGPLDSIDLDILGYIDHNITVNIIRDDKIAEKRTLHLPKILKNVVHCKNRAASPPSSRSCRIFSISMIRIMRYIAADIVMRSTVDSASAGCEVL